MIENTKKPMAENTKKNQQFSTFDVLSVLLSITLVIGLSFVFFNKSLNRKKSDIAKNNLENLALDLLGKPVIYSQGQNSREPASSLDLGLDPWGSPYVYNIVKNTYGQPIYLVVMSPGPDSKLDTKVETQAQWEISQIEQIHFQNDDIGYVKSFR